MVAAAIAPSIIAVIGVTVGALVAMVGSYLATVVQTSAQREARRDEARERHEQARRDFQRETLIALQDAIAELVRAAGEAHYADVVHHRTTREAWARQPLPEGVSDRMHRATVESLKLTTRVEDDDLRAKLTGLRGLVTEISGARTEDDALDRLGRANEVYSDVVEQIGRVFRSL